MNTKPLYIFRADAGVDMGTGHIMRCLALADIIKQHGGETQFICRACPGHLEDLIHKRGHEAILLPMFPDKNRTETGKIDADMLTVPFSQSFDVDQTLALLQKQRPQWLIVDHYGITAHWHEQLRPYAERIMVIDDLAQNTFNCDVLLNQNLAYAESDYVSRIPTECTLILSPQYALLKPEFSKLHSAALEKRKDCHSMRRVLISIGGMDPNNLIGSILEDLSKLDSFRDMKVDIAVSSQSPNMKTLAAQIETLPFSADILWDAGNMAKLMLAADYAIGAAGSSSWERCCMALPSIVFELADNQADNARSLADRQAAKVIHESAEISTYIDWGDDYFTYAQNAARICDGKGCERVIGIILDP